MQPKREIITTADGSKTIHIPDWNENYHSSHGALQEANHVFLRSGFDVFAQQQEISIFEVGFGTGLNAILTLQEAENHQILVNYAGIEAYPVSPQEIEALAYETLLNDDESKDHYAAMHAADWNVPTQLSPHFSLNKIHQKLEDYTFQPNQFDILYFDAFGPRTQEDMWSQEHFIKLYSALKPNGLLVTYCAKGQVKRDLKAAGFFIEALPGPPGKREMTRAWKTEMTKLEFEKRTLSA